MKLKYKTISYSILFTLIANPILFAQIPNDYKGEPYIDRIFNPIIQTIPGRIDFAFYDRGGEGVAYHDTDAKNNGSGGLNREAIHIRPGVADDIVHFREFEGVDVSFTKDFADFNHGNNIVWPGVNQLYLGWEEDGEWTNYTVDVKVAGTYKVILLYGFEDNGSYLSLNGEKAVDLPFPINTGGFHYWNNAHVATMEFSKTGLNLVTLHYNQGANLAYVDFVLIN